MDGRLEATQLPHHIRRFFDELENSERISPLPLCNPASHEAFRRSSRISRAVEHDRGRARRSCWSRSPAAAGRHRGRSRLRKFRRRTDSVVFHFNGVAGNGKGETIAIVDAYDDPNIQADLNTFDTEFGLPAITVDAG